jgi:hypothetical protein
MREAQHLARCRTCREADTIVGPALRTTTTERMTASEADRIWRAVRIEIAERRHFGLASIVAWLRGTERRRPSLVWASVAIAALLLVLIPLHVGRDRAVFSQAELNAATVIEHVDVARSTSVLVLETETAHTPIIWIVEGEPW